VEEGRGLVWCAHELEEGAQLTTPTEAAFGRAAQGRARREKGIRRVGHATGRLLGHHSQPEGNSARSQLFKNFSNRFELIQSKDGIPVL
jgi:hypothetical protein